jgi:hypothetical protein
MFGLQSVASGELRDHIKLNKKLVIDLHQVSMPFDRTD